MAKKRNVTVEHVEEVEPAKVLPPETVSEAVYLEAIFAVAALLQAFSTVEAAHCINLIGCGGKRHAGACPMRAMQDARELLERGR